MENTDTPEFNDPDFQSIPSSKLGLKNSMTAIPDKVPYGFWVDRHGNFAVCPNRMSHGPVGNSIMENAAKLGVELPENSNCYDYLMDNGFVRVVLNHGKVYYGTFSPQLVTPSQSKFINFINDFYNMKGSEFDLAWR